MEPESDTVIDVEIEAINTPDRKSIQQWYSACQLQSMLDLNKAGLQKAIAKLQAIYGIRLDLLRRGSARATEYSQLALEAIELLNSQKFAELRLLTQAASPPKTETLAISEYTPALDRRITQLGQNAASVSASLNQNVMQTLKQIVSENEAAQQRDSELSAARINAAQNRGAVQALAIFQAEQKAQNELLAQLRAMQLGGAE